MRILIVTNMYPSEGDVSWRGSFVKEQIEAYRQQYRDSEIHVFHIKGKISGGSNTNYITCFPLLTWKLLFGKYDIVHCHHAFCVLLCLPWFYRIIYTVHEGELNNTSLRSKLIKLAIHLSKIPVFVSRKEFERSSKKHKKLLPCGVDFNTFTPAPNKTELRHELNFPLDKAVVLFPADPNRPEKNASILRAAELLAQNDGKQWLFIYGGKIPKENMPKWMAAADVVVSIGQYESDGMVIKEAIACNTPVLSTDVGNSSYYIDDSCGILVTADPQSVYDGLNILTNNSRQFIYGRERLKTLEQDIHSVAENLDKIYKKSCGAQ